jgi:hypothetical protein
MAFRVKEAIAVRHARRDKVIVQHVGHCVQLHRLVACMLRVHPIPGEVAGLATASDRLKVQ